jgi:hypothetical protein
MKRVFSVPSLSTSAAGASVVPCMYFPSVAAQWIHCALVSPG